MTATLDSALADWRVALGPDGVRDDAGARARVAANVSGFVRRVPAVLLPRTVGEVQAAVRIAARARVPLHPISCGANWGMGSRLPVRDGAVILELSRLNRIRELRPEARYAVIEAGVTQGQLSDVLRERRLPLIVNVTGSARATSVIGNALERGVGYLAPRADQLSGLEVVLADGELLRTGFARFEGAATAHRFRHGVGPSLDGLFFQSGLGVVTAAGFELHPMPEGASALVLRMRREENLGPAVDAIARLRRRGVLSGVAHIGNRARSLVTLAPLVAAELMEDGGDEAVRRDRALRALERQGFGAWSAVLGFGGAPAVRRWILRELRAELGGLGRLLVLTPGRIAVADRLLGALAGVRWCREQRALLRAAAPFNRLALGEPTDAALASIYWPIPGATAPPDGDPDDCPDAGLLYALPLLPAEGAAARACAEGAERIFRARGFEPMITFNPLDDRAMEGVISLAFPRSDAGRDAAGLACIREAEAWFIESGWPPYRVGIESMDLLRRPGSVYDRTLSALQSALDPHGILAPGRYRP
jgi:4-cresol dehydrogenase (hydroxylating) flavoprotein subunit